MKTAFYLLACIFLISSCSSRLQQEKSFGGSWKKNTNEAVKISEISPDFVQSQSITTDFQSTQVKNICGHKQIKKQYKTPIAKQLIQTKQTPKKIISDFRNTAKTSGDAGIIVITILVAFATLIGIYFLFGALGLTINLKKFLLGFLLLTLLVMMMIAAG